MVSYLEYLIDSHDTLTVKLTALIATHDDPLYRLLQPALNELDFEVTLTTDDAATLRSLESTKPGLLLLHESLPTSGGLDVCRKLRRNRATADIPTIVITTGTLAADRAAALNVGADDCVSPPLQMDELVARIRALERRTPLRSSSGYLRAGPIEMDLDRWIVQVQGRAVELTRMEFRLLQSLLEAKGRALSRDMLLQRISSHSVVHGLETRTVDVHIGRLRGKLGHAGSHIITVRNVGFRFDIVPEWITSQTAAKPAQRNQHGQPRSTDSN